MSVQTLSDRMKSYEDKARFYLDKDFPVIIRIDGSNFSKLTKGLNKPYDDKFIELINNTALHVISNMQGFRFATVQSDEINICLMTANEKSQAHYGNNINKLVSLTAADAASYFSVNSKDVFGEVKLASFDSRAFSIPKEEVFNYFLNRQVDTYRNAIQMAARTVASPKEIFNKNNEELKSFMFSRGLDFESLPNYFKYGRSIYNIKVTKPHPIDPSLLVERSQFFVNKDSCNFLDIRDKIENYFV
jgi:tRNA(His) guanylyltransferase